MTLAMASYGLYTPHPVEPAPLDRAAGWLVPARLRLVYAGALVAEALSVNADLDTLLQLAWNDLIQRAPGSDTRHRGSGSPSPITFTRA